MSIGFYFNLADRILSDRACRYMFRRYHLDWHFLAMCLQNAEIQVILTMSLLVSKWLGLFAGNTNCLKDWHGIVEAVLKCPAHPIIKVSILSTDVFVGFFD